MRAYNVEFFDRSFNFITNQMTSDFSYAYDYLSRTANVVSLRNDELIAIGQYIRITGGAKEIHGIVSAVDHGKGLSNIGFVPLTDLLNIDILFDTDLQGGDTPFEDWLESCITSIYITNSDTLQRVPGLSVAVTSSTEDWGFNLKSTNAGMHTIIVNLWETILTKALSKYQVVVDMKMDVGRKAITCTIGRNASARYVIEADLPNVVERNIVTDASNESANKAIIYNGHDYSQSAKYYRHPDGTYDTQNRDRITPVLRVLDEVTLNEGETFSKAAQSKANDLLGQAAYNNLIELRVLQDDELVRAGDIDIGQIVTVISGGTEYTSILSGFIIDQMMTLTFGIIRLDLTKQIRR